MDSIPVVSQLKSLTQWAFGESDGARQTQENFSRGCPIVSQFRSAFEAINGDTEAATNTQMYFLRNMEGVVDNCPGIGHIKGAGHYIAGDNERGDEIMKAASRSTGVIGGGFAGFVTGGPVGAWAGGIAGGALMDGVITGAESAIQGEYCPYGTVDGVTQIINGEASVGDIFETLATPIMDGYCGTTIESVPKKIPKYKKFAKNSGRFVAEEMVLAEDFSSYNEKY